MSNRRLHVLSLVVLGIFCLLAAGSDDTSTGANKAPAVSIAEKPDSPEMLRNAEALEDKYEIAASASCSSRADDYLKEVAKYDYKWDDIGFLETKFDHYLKHVKSPGVLTLTSDKVKLQNGFGAFQRVEVTCDYDTQAQLVLGFSLIQR